MRVHVDSRPEVNLILLSQLTILLLINKILPSLIHLIHTIVSNVAIIITIVHIIHIIIVFHLNNVYLSLSLLLVVM